MTSHAHHSAADRCDFSYAAMPPSASLQQQAHLWRLWPLALGSVERLQLPCGDVARSARLPQGRSAWLQKGLGAAGREALHALQMAQHWLEVALRALGLQSQRARPRLQPLRAAHRPDSPSARAPRVRRAPRPRAPSKKPMASVAHHCHPGTRSPCPVVGPPARSGTNSQQGQLHYFLPLLRLAQRAAPSASACQLMREVGIATCNGDLPPHRRT